MHGCLCDNVFMSQGHQVDLAAIDAEMADTVAATMQALAAPSRVRILARLGAGDCAVTDLAADIAMSQPAVSQQLRVLRYLGVVVGHRNGRRIVYSLHDDHVRSLLTEAISHAEHVRLGVYAHAQSEAA